MANSINSIKDFNLIKMELVSASGDSVDIRYITIEFNVYEDLYNNNVTADIVINDAKNMLMNFPIFGYETLNLAFATPTKETWEKTLRLTRITQPTLLKERERAYILHFTTPEVITNLKTRVQKSYKGKLISDIVTDIHENFLMNDNIDVEITKFQHHIIVPNMHPCHALNWLTTRANSQTYEGANYLYYEDKDGYNFVSIESKLAQPIQKTYLFQIVNVRDGTASGYKARDASDQVSVESYVFENMSDILENMHRGMYGSNLLTYSQSKKQWMSYDFDYPTSFDAYKHLYQGNYLYSRVHGDLAAPQNKLKFHPVGQDPYPFMSEKWMQPRISQLQQLQNIRLTITVPGDSERTVGQVVEFILPSPEPPIQNNQVLDKHLQGKYLIQSVRHKIDPNQYVSTLELTKDSTFSPYN